MHCLQLAVAACDSKCPCRRGKNERCLKPAARRWAVLQTSQRRRHSRCMGCCGGCGLRAVAIACCWTQYTCSGIDGTAEEERRKQLRAGDDARWSGISVNHNLTKNGQPGSGTGRFVSTGQGGIMALPWSGSRALL